MACLIADGVSFVFGIFAMIGIIFLGREIQNQSGMGYRFTASAAYLGGDFQTQMRKNLEDDYQQNSAACDFSQSEKKTNQPKADIAKSCYEADPKNQAVFLWGDSHAQMLGYGLRNNLPADWQASPPATTRENSIPPARWILRRRGPDKF